MEITRNDSNDSGLSLKLQEAAVEEDADSHFPVVFQCSQCNSIIGDSTSWGSANGIMRTISIKRVTNKVGLKPDLSTSMSGIDIGSTYKTLFCEVCQEELGKKYFTSSPEFDPLRGLFTFNVDKLSSYQIGSAEQSGDVGLADYMTLPSLRSLQKDIHMIHTLVLGHEKRLKAVENCLAEDCDQTDGMSSNQERASEVSSEISEGPPQNITHNSRNQKDRQQTSPFKQRQRQMENHPQNSSNGFQGKNNRAFVHPDDENYDPNDGLASKHGRDNFRQQSTRTNGQQNRSYEEQELLEDTGHSRRLSLSKGTPAHSRRHMNNVEEISSPHRSDRLSSRPPTKRKRLETYENGH